MGDESSDIGESETGATFHDMMPLRIGLDAIGVDPSQCRGHHTEIQMIDSTESIRSVVKKATHGVFRNTHTTRIGQRGEMRGNINGLPSKTGVYGRTLA